MKLKFLFVFVIVAGLLSCGETKKEEDIDPMPVQSEMHQPDVDAEEMEISARFSNDTIAKAYEQYLKIKDALVREDVDAVIEAAEKMVEAYGENAQFSEIGARAQRFTGSYNIYKQRDVFSSLTRAMEPILKEAISEGEIYKQYCPMAFGGRGDYWYSNSEEIRNPYFGDKMLKCGRVEETIK